jgi:hypothetical protein
MVLLSIIPALFILPMVIPRIVFLVVSVYFKEIKAAVSSEAISYFKERCFKRGSD